MRWFTVSVVSCQSSVATAYFLKSRRSGERDLGYARCLLPTAFCLLLSAFCFSADPEQDNRLVVARRATLLILPHFFEKSIDDLLRGAMEMLAQYVLKASRPEFLVLGVRRFDDAIRKHCEQIPRLQPHRYFLVLGVFHQAQRDSLSANGPALTFPHQEG